MLVLVTGGTGFLGSHTVAALVRAGHRVRLLARDMFRVEPALGPLGVPLGSLEIRTADARDESAVSAALRDCDALVHAAGVYSFDGRDTRRIREFNLAAAEVVLGAARRAGTRRSVHVSSVAALCRPGPDPLTVDSPVGRSPVPYMASMAQTDLVARRYQSEGDPVVIAYPPATLGPHDPHLGDQIVRVRNTLRGRIPVWPTSGIAIADVRDVADLVTAAVEPGFAAARCAPPATFLTTRDYMATLREVTGRRLPAVHAPSAALLPLGRAVSAVQRFVPWHIPAEFGAIYACHCQPRMVPESMTRLPGVSPRTIEETMTDSVRWLHERGHLTARQAGAALGVQRLDGTGRTGSQGAAPAPTAR